MAEGFAMLQILSCDLRGVVGMVVVVMVVPSGKGRHGCTQQQHSG